MKFTVNQNVVLQFGPELFEGVVVEVRDDGTYDVAHDLDDRFVCVALSVSREKLSPSNDLRDYFEIVQRLRR